MARWVVALGTLAATATAFKTLDKDDYDVNYRGRAFGGKVTFEVTMDSIDHNYPLHGTDIDTTRELFTGVPGGGAPRLRNGQPMAYAKGDGKFLIVGLNERTATHAQGDEVPVQNGGFVTLSTVKNDRWANAIVPGSLPKSAKGENNADKKIIDNELVYYSAKDTATQNPCRINIGSAVTVSDDGLTFAYTCQECATTAAGGGAADKRCDSMEGIVGVAKWDGKEWNFVYIRPDSTAKTVTKDSDGSDEFGASIALSGNGKTLFISDTSNDRIYAFHWSLTDPDVANDCEAAGGDDWYDGCMIKAYPQNDKMGYWYARNGDSTGALTFKKGVADFRIGAKSDFGMFLSTDTTGSRLAVASMQNIRGTAGDLGDITVFKKRSTHGWFRTSTGGALVNGLNADATNNQILFHKSAETSGLGINVALSRDGKYVAFTDPSQDEEDSLVTGTGTAYLCKISSEPFSDQKLHHCQHAYGAKDEYIGGSRFAVDVSADGKIMTIGVPVSDKEHRRRRTTAMEHKQDNGHVMFVKWDEEDDSTTLKSYAHKDDMHGTTNNANMGLAVRCDKECDRVAANDAYHALVGQSDSPSDDDGLTTGEKYAIGFGVGVPAAGLLVYGGYKAWPMLSRATAPMGYASANGESMM